ncbi:MAG: glutamine synthetase family protein [Terriglobales bacterium]
MNKPPLSPPMEPLDYPASAVRNEVSTLVEDPRTDTVTAAVTDGFGRLMGKRLTKRYYNATERKKPILMCEAIFATDIRLGDVPNILGQNASFQDFQAIPDNSTACRSPWAPNEVLLLCDCMRMTGEPLAISPRQILKAQIDAAAAMGLKFQMASELEFYLLGATDELPPTQISRQRLRDAGQRQDYHLGQTAVDEPVIAQLRNDLPAMGIPVEYHKGEGGTGQHEIVVGHAGALAAADRHVLFKHAVKQVAANAGRVATFVAKLSDFEDGSGGHVHCSLWSLNGRSAGGTSSRKDELSPEMQSFIAGIIAYIPELMPLCAPLVNSYKRYRPGVFAPYDLRWAFDDRRAAVRVLGEGDSLRLEFRIPGADMNPYLAYSALIASGLEGLRQRLELPAPGEPPVAGPTLPATLSAAVRAFEQSAFARSAFGVETVQYYAALSGWEANLYAVTVTDWERARYYREA